MARKDGGESEGIVLYPSRSPSFGWKPTPLAPLVRGVKAMRPTRGWKKSPPDKGGWGVVARKVGGKTRPRKENHSPLEGESVR